MRGLHGEESGCTGRVVEETPDEDCVNETCDVCTPRKAEPMLPMLCNHGLRFRVEREVPSEKHGGCVQVVLTPELRKVFEPWLALHGRVLYRMPVDNPDDLDTYGIGIKQ